MGQNEADGGLGDHQQLRMPSLIYNGATVCSSPDNLLVYTYLLAIRYFQQKQKCIYVEAKVLLAPESKIHYLDR